ncbi:MAG: EAL domain-containing protein [Pseudanabaenaceae cyanobacterium]
MTFVNSTNEILNSIDLELEPVPVLTADAPLKQAITMMAGQEKGASHSCILVTEENKIIGILTERDLVRLSLASITLSQSTVGAVMTSPVITLEEENLTDIFSVYSLMRRHRIRHLPVTKSETIKGIVTISSLRRSLHLGYFLRFREVREIMTHKVVTATPQTPVLEIAQLMAVNRISCIIIVEKHDDGVKPVGILTERDIVQLQGMELNLQNLVTAEVMSQPLFYLQPEDSLATAQKMMQQYRVRRLVIVDRYGTLQGIITETNLSMILDPLELFGMLEILQHRIEILIRDRDRLLPKENSYLRDALENHEFKLHYQPQVDIEKKQVIGAEALVRWHSPQRGIISPSEFIPIAEMTGFIISLGEWILREACTQIMAWQKKGLPPLVISVNVSSHQLRNSQLVPYLRNLLTELDLDPQWLKLELTESSLVQDIEHTLAQFQAIKKLGVAIAIDDFGTGYASLGYLQHFPFDTLKIDRCFVDNIHNNSKNAAITTAIIRMAQQLNFSVVAEGVEQDAELAFLRQRHCHIIQGYLISPPLLREQFEEFLRTTSFVPELDGVIGG